MRSKHIFIPFLVSVLLHLTLVLVFEEYWSQVPQMEIFQARLAQRPRFIEPPKLPRSALDLMQVEMEYLRPEAAPEYALEEALSVEHRPRTPDDALEALDLETEQVLAAKSSAPELDREVMPSVGGPVFIDTVESEAFDLLRLEDMSRADGQRSVVIPDLRNKRDVRGYINFTHLYLDGATTHPGKVLDMLARYLRDYTGILARVRDQSRQYFLSPQLLKDPIHFMFPGRRRGGGDTEQLLYLSDEELALMGRYLRSGGFLFIEGGRGGEDIGSDGDTGGGGDSEDIENLKRSGSWLGQAMAYVYRALDGEGRLIEVPFIHPIYHSFYDYDTGFPGAEQKQLLNIPLPRWYFSTGYKDRKGIWGVELNGALVAIFSDMDLHGNWIAESEDGGSATTLFLQAATNIVVYALTRQEGLTPKRPPPAWQVSFPEMPVVLEPVGNAEDALDEDLWDVMDASVVLLHTPVGHRMVDGGLKLRVDGGYELEIVEGGQHALVLHNLAAGRHRFELDYDGQQQNLEVELKGGRTLVLDFGIDRLVFWQRLRLEAQKEWLDADAWQLHFAGLEIEEVWLGNAELDLD
jgi:hypothetical protein